MQRESLTVSVQYKMCLIYWLESPSLLSYCKSSHWNPNLCSTTVNFSSVLWVLCWNMQCLTYGRRHSFCIFASKNITMCPLMCWFYLTLAEQCTPFCFHLFFPPVQLKSLPCLKTIFFAISLSVAFACSLNEGISSLWMAVWTFYN